MNFPRSRYSRFATLGNNGPVRQKNDEIHFAQWSFYRVREADEPERYGLRLKFLSLQRAELRVVKGRHKIGSDLGGFLFGDSIGGVLFSSLENVFECAAVFRLRLDTGIARRTTLESPP
jgi:hypothetical protein